MTFDAVGWAATLREHGHAVPPAGLDVLGSGMEGTVVRLGRDLVAKVWHRRTVEEATLARDFHDSLAATRPALDHPRVLEVVVRDGQVATVEPFLAGRPGAASDLDAVVDVLAVLATVPPQPGLAVLPVLEGEGTFDPAGSFPHQLADLVRRRVDRFRGPLAARLPDLDGLAASTVARLTALEVARPCLVHGDLIPANVLVDADGRATGVLDFGFLTTVGDPAFDAAVTASVFDMYGPQARANESALDGAITERFGHDPGRLAVYRAAYALVTSNCFSASGGDGHFEWCAQMLERRDVRAAL